MGSARRKALPGHRRPAGRLAGWISTRVQRYARDRLPVFTKISQPQPLMNPNRNLSKLTFLLKSQNLSIFMSKVKISDQKFSDTSSFHRQSVELRPHLKRHPKTRKTRNLCSILMLKNPCNFLKSERNLSKLTNSLITFSKLPKRPCRIAALIVKFTK